VDDEVFCSPVTDLCHSGHCEECSSGGIFFFRHPVPNLDDAGECTSTQVTIQVWVQDEVTGYPVRVDVTMRCSEGFERLEKVFPKFILHYCVKRHQSMMYRNQKMYITSSKEPPLQTLLIHFDFAENFRCSSQDQIQSAYYAERQISLLTVVVISASQTSSFVLVHNDLDHGKVAVSKYLLLLFQVDAAKIFSVLLFTAVGFIVFYAALCQW
jgi:hypothetical protein